MCECMKKRIKLSKCIQIVTISRAQTEYKIKHDRKTKQTIFLLFERKNAFHWSKMLFKRSTCRISQFSAYALALFTEYTAWPTFGECQELAL